MELSKLLNPPTMFYEQQPTTNVIFVLLPNTRFMLNTKDTSSLSLQPPMTTIPLVARPILQNNTDDSAELRNTASMSEELSKFLDIPSVKEAPTPGQKAIILYYKFNLKKAQISRLLHMHTTTVTRAVDAFRQGRSPNKVGRPRKSVQKTPPKSISQK